jgi:serine/threonine-protein kinase 24/25/MST4
MTLHVCYNLSLVHEVTGPPLSFMSPMRRQSHSDDPIPQIKNLARSPPPSPQAEKSRPREPYPIPSSNPASQYTLLEKLGTGSFGVVYKAIHNDTKQIVAVKQIGKAR